MRRAHKEGRPGELHFRRWTGEGQLAMQLQRTSRDPPPAHPQRLTADDSPWLGKVQLSAQMAATPEEWANRPTR